MLELGNIIRENRLKLGMTQEHFARQLNVSAPAVSKWEKSQSYPDITLLPRIARTLGIDLNHLLSFSSTITQPEIRAFSAKLATKDGFSAYEFAKSKINDFPNSDQLKTIVCIFLTVQQNNMSKEQWVIVSQYIEANYLQLMGSRDAKAAQQAAQSLFYYYLSQNRYNDAEQQVEKLSDATVAYNAMKPELYMRKGDVQQTYVTGEDLLAQDANGLQKALSILIKNALSENNLEYAKQCVSVGHGLVDLLKQSNAFQADSELLVAKTTHNQNQVADVLLNLVSSFNTQEIPQLAAHRLMPEPASDEEKKQTVSLMLRQFLADPELEFAWDNERLQSLLKEYGVNAND